MSLFGKKKTPVEIEMGKKIFSINDYASRKAFEEDVNRLKGLNVIIHYSDGTTSLEDFKPKGNQK